MAARPIDHNRADPLAFLRFLRDVRVLQIIGQIIFAIVIVVFVSQIATAILHALEVKNLTPNLTFLRDRAGFDIGEPPTWYTSNSNYGTAFVAGLVNTLRVVTAGLVLTTLLGVAAGVLLLSSNWLVRNFVRVVVEIIHDTPLLAQLLLWYQVIRLALPAPQQPLTLPAEGVTLIPWRLFIDAILLFMIWRSVGRLPTDAPRRALLLYGVLAFAILVELAFWLPGTRPLYGQSSLSSGAFWLYLIVSLILLAAAWRAPGHLRWLALGAAGGQLIGGLLFYFGITPTGGLRLELYPAVYMSIRGFVFPQLLATSRFAEWAAFVAVGIALAGMMWVYFGRITETTGRPIPRAWYGFLAVVGFALVGWLVVGTQPTPSEITVKKDDQPVTLTLADARKDNLLTLQDEQLYSTQPVLFILPQRTGLRIENGVEISPEYMFLLIGLVVYTASFIAEIVRAGIQAVPPGQLEASRALGFSTGQTLRMIILPQALRVIIPPLGNQYLNLSKNSSLAIAIAYADLFAVTNTIMNQSGQSVTGMTMVMFTYLAMSLTIASLMGRVNRRFQIVTR